MLFHIMDTLVCLGDLFWEFFVLFWIAFVFVVVLGDTKI